MQIASAPVQSNQLSRIETYTQKTFKLAIGLTLLMTVLAVIFYTFIQPVIPVFYTLTQPDKQLAPKIWLFIFPVFSWLVTFLHFTLIKTLKTIEGSVGKMFCWTTVGVIAITSLLFARIIFIVL